VPRSHVGAICAPQASGVKPSGRSFDPPRLHGIMAAWNFPPASS
jgi:hypothetical protein